MVSMTRAPSTRVDRGEDRVPVVGVARVDGDVAHERARRPRRGRSRRSSRRPRRSRSATWPSMPGRSAISTRIVRLYWAEGVGARDGRAYRGRGSPPGPPPGAAARVPDVADVPDELYLIDGNRLAYRAFFALPESIATSTGLPTNAIFGFASMLVKMLTEHGPKPTIVVLGRRASRAARRSTPSTRRQRTSRPDLLERAVAAPRAARRRVRLPQRARRGLRGRRRDRLDRRARARAGRPGR